MYIPWSNNNYKKWQYVSLFSHSSSELNNYMLRTINPLLWQVDDLSTDIDVVRVRSSPTNSVNTRGKFKQIMWSLHNQIMASVLTKRTSIGDLCIMHTPVYTTSIGDYIGMYMYILVLGNTPVCTSIDFAIPVVRIAMFDAQVHLTCIHVSTHPKLG